MHGSRLREKPCYKGIRWKVMELASEVLRLLHIHRGMLTHTQVHIHYRQRGDTNYNPYIKTPGMCAQHAVGHFWQRSFL